MAVAKQEADEWAILPASKATTSVTPDTDHDYDLFNSKIGEALVYGERRWGINLVWGDPTNSNNVRFAAESGSQNPLRYGEQVAINVRGGGWLVYRRRDWGINLGWSDVPRYEWRIDGGQGAIRLPGLIGLHNNVENDWLMYVPRDWGINLRWSADRDTPTSWWVDAASAGSTLKDVWDKL